MRLRLNWTLDGQKQKGHFMIIRYPEGYEFIGNIGCSEATVGKKFYPLPEKAFDDCAPLSHMKDWKYQIKKKGRHCDCEGAVNTFILRLQDTTGSVFETTYEFSNGGGLCGFGDTLEFSRLTDGVTDNSKSSCG